MSSRPSQVLVLGPLPVEKINATVGTELDPGNVVLSRATQEHARRRHPTDFATCFPHVASTVLEPLYIGDDHRNHGKIELVKRIPAANINLLVAVILEPDGNGQYHVASFYPVSEDKIQNRRDRGFLKSAAILPPAPEPDKAPAEEGLAVVDGE